MCAVVFGRRNVVLDHCLFVFDAKGISLLRDSIIQFRIEMVCSRDCLSIEGPRCKRSGEIAVIKAGCAPATAVLSMAAYR